MSTYLDTTVNEVSELLGGLIAIDLPFRGNESHRWQSSMLISFPRWETMSNTTGSLWFEASNQGTGSQLGTNKRLSRQYLSLARGFTADARMQLSKITDRIRVEIAQDMLGELETAARWRADLTVFPVYVVESDVSGAIFIEWILLTCRVGITIEMEAGESGWYFICQDSSGTLESQYGDMGSFDAARIVAQIPLQSA